ncbi:MAG: hypothetical protein KGJ95_06150 [Candidatus Omnitrophica bacterium]|nr:hypothetical protein [Candidatus Omnitrophota bacterium]
MMNTTDKKGQTALILVLLSAMALIFLAITYNWGRIAQMKSLLTVDADQAASLLASDVASYGEMQKQTNLQDTNKISGMSGLLMDLIMVIVIIIIIVIEIVSWGSATPLVTTFLGACLTLALVMSIVTLVLQLTVIQPGMCELWNKLQKSQPITQQFYEGAVGPALQGATTDQVNITDYFDENANGKFGVTSGRANDTISRFGFFYTERLKMLNKNVGFIPQLVFFYNQLSEFINGQTCQQNYTDSGSVDGKTSQTGVPLNPSCFNPNAGIDYCAVDSADPACTGPIPAQVTCAQNVYEHSNLTDPNTGQPVALDPLCNSCNAAYTTYSASLSAPSCRVMVNNDFSFQLNDSCTDTSNPYCNPCCQPVAVAVTDNGKTTYKPLRPSSCLPYVSAGGTLPDVCATNPNAYINTDCSALVGDPDNAGQAAPAQCTSNNPYGSSYPFIYDSGFQQYSRGLSFLDQYGRDQQLMQSTPTTVPLGGMTVEGTSPAFPNGIYPFFWLMDTNPAFPDPLASPNAYKTPNYFSPAVDSINTTQSNNFTLTPEPWYHWCVAGTYSGGTVPAVNSPSSADFPDLNQLTLPYSCSGEDCCVNYLTDSLAGGSGSSSNTLTIVVGPNISMVINSPFSGNIYTAGPSSSISMLATASEPSPGTITGVDINMTDPTGSTSTLDDTLFTPNPAFPAPIVQINTNPGQFAIPTSVTNKTTGLCTVTMAGNYNVTAVATDAPLSEVQSYDTGGATGAVTNYCATNPTDHSCGYTAYATTMIVNNYSYCAAIDNCGKDACGVTCGTGACTNGQTCYETTFNGTSWTITGTQASGSQTGECKCAGGNLGDNNNCGTCGKVCQNGETCQSNACACASGTLNDNNNCGTCGHVCQGQEICQSGSCGCPSGTTQCGASTNCCTSTQSCNLGTGVCS